MKRETLSVSLLSAILSLSVPSQGYQAGDAKGPLTGRWLVTANYYGTPLYLGLDLVQQGEALTGKFSGDKLEGTVKGDTIYFLAKDGQGGTDEIKGTIKGGVFTGSVAFQNADHQDAPSGAAFTATLVPARPSGPPQRHEFTPTVFYRQYSRLNTPVLRVAPGDTIHTSTVDAGGADSKGVRRVMGGNPQTGPFYIESAMPGDTLVVHLTRVRLNRDWAISTDTIVSRGVDNDLAVKMKDTGKTVRWHLDLEKGLASLDTPGEHMANYRVPMHPMMGCIAVAPGPAQAPPGTGDSGSWGGNMDFNELVEGATLYLPVQNPGALLYLGDGHAVQGDGELTGDALETSMDVEFTVDVIPGKRTPGRRVESPTHLIAMGLDGSLDEAFRSATSNMARWLADDYKLTPPEVSEVLGTAAEYKVSEAADRNAGIVLKISKERLKTLSPGTK
jgi:amidase